MENLDDEDINDYQPSPVPKTKEQERFTKDKEEFKRKYKEQIDQVGKTAHSKKFN